MDLIAEYQHIVPGADFTHRPQFRLRPDIAGRVMRMTQDKQARVGLDRRLELALVKTVALAIEVQWRQRQASTVHLGIIMKVHVDRWLDQHRVTR